MNAFYSLYSSCVKWSCLLPTLHTSSECSSAHSKAKEMCMAAAVRVLENQTLITPALCRVKSRIFRLAFSSSLVDKGRLERSEKEIPRHHFPTQICAHCRVLFHIQQFDIHIQIFHFLSLPSSMLSFVDCVGKLLTLTSTREKFTRSEIQL